MVGFRLIHLAERVEVVASQVVQVVALEEDLVEASAEAVVLAQELVDFPAASVAIMEMDAVDLDRLVQVAEALEAA